MARKYFCLPTINPIWELNSIFLSEFMEFCENEIFCYQQSNVVYKRPQNHSDEVKISYLMFPNWHVCEWNPIWSPKSKIAAKNIRISFQKSKASITSNWHELYMNLPQSNPIWQLNVIIIAYAKIWGYHCFIPILISRFSIYNSWFALNHHYDE